MAVAIENLELFFNENPNLPLDRAAVITAAKKAVNNHGLVPSRTATELLGAHADLFFQQFARSYKHRQILLHAHPTLIFNLI